MVWISIKQNWSKNIKYVENRNIEVLKQQKQLNFNKFVQNYEKNLTEKFS